MYIYITSFNKSITSLKNRSGGFFLYSIAFLNAISNIFTTFTPVAAETKKNPKL